MSHCQGCGRTDMAGITHVCPPPESAWTYSEEAVSLNDPMRLRGLVNEANERARHPIDLNYVAIPKDTWERIVGLVNRA